MDGELCEDATPAISAFIGPAIPANLTAIDLGWFSSKTKLVGRTKGLVT